jgi:hypothetical protein
VGSGEGVRGISSMSDSREDDDEEDEVERYEDMRSGARWPLELVSRIEGDEDELGERVEAMGA